MFKTSLVLLLFIGSFWLPIPQVNAQHQEGHIHPVISEINNSYQQGKISLDQKILYKFYSGLNSEMLPASLYESSGAPLKCGTPIYLEYLKAKKDLRLSTVDQIETMTRRSQAVYTNTYLSPSGKFLLHYETSGSDAVPLEDTSPANGIPDYIDEAAAAADSSWRHEINNLGYTDPVDPDTPYDIFFRNFNFYGQTVLQGNETYIEVHNNFIDFPPNTDPEGNPIGALKVTLAHELKHAIQYANSQWYTSTSEGESPHNFNWTEMDATYMEEVVYDNVNDYYNYLTSSNSIFLSPDEGIPGGYWQVSWFLYFDQKFGNSFWVDVWQAIKQRFEEQNTMASPDYFNMKEAITLILENRYNQTFPFTLLESHFWHFASGPSNSTPFYGFEERNNYPDPHFNNSITETFTDTLQLMPMAAEYFLIQPNTAATGGITVSVDSVITENLSMGLLYYFKDGRFEVQALSLDASTLSNYKSPWSWEEVQKVGIIFSNASRQITPYRFKIASSKNQPPESTTDEFTETQIIESKTSDHYVFNSSANIKGDIGFSIFSDSPSLELEFRFELKSGGLEIQKKTLNESPKTEFIFPRKWNEINRVEVVVSNPEINSISYRYRIFSTIPETYTLSQNYPNPFNPTTVIRFTLPVSSPVELKVYDITGRLVRILFEGQLSVGTHEVPFNGNGLASGIYLYQLVTNQKILTRKMTLIK